MSKAQMIARAWLDDGYRAALAAQGLEVPPRPSDLADDQLDRLAADDQEQVSGSACIC